MIRLDVTDFISRNDFRPSMFYYLYAPGALRGYENHSFTLCSWKRKLTRAPETSSAPFLQNITGDARAQDTGLWPYSADSSEEDVCRSFLIRPYDGFTARL